MIDTPHLKIDSPKMRQLITAFDQAADEQQIMVLLRRVCQQMEYDFFRLGFIYPASIQRPKVVFFNGCPAPWVEIYSQQQLITVDPLVRTGMKQSTPILWQSVLHDCKQQGDEAGLAVLAKAKEAGLVDGMTLPCHGANGQVSLLSFACCTPQKASFWLKQQSYLTLLSLHIFEAVSRVCMKVFAAKGELTQRELEVSQWAAEGKQVSDIAKILDISPRTVTFHLENVVSKMGVSNKSQAISLALKQGLVQLNVAAAQIGNINEHTDVPLAALEKKAERQSYPRKN